MYNFEEGMMVKITGNTSNHNIPVGTKIQLGKKSPGNRWRDSMTGKVIDYKDIIPVIPTKDDIKEQIEIARKVLLQLEDKQNWMENKKVELLDEEEYKTDTIIKKLDSIKDTNDYSEILNTYLKNNEEFKTGMSVKIINDTCNHSIPIGTIITLSTKVNNTKCTWCVKEYKINVTKKDIESIKFTVEELQEELAKIEDEAAKIQEYIKWMKSSNITHFHEDLYNKYKMMKKYSKLRSKEQKKKLVKKLLEQ